MRLLSAVLFTTLAVSACGGDEVTRDPGLEGLSIESVQPSILVPGSKIVVTGHSFITEDWGAASLELAGKSIPLQFVDFHRYEASVTADLIAILGEDSIAGEARIAIDSYVDGNTYTSEAISVDLEIQSELKPALLEVAAGSLIYVNDRIELSTEGLLLSKSEGQTMALVSGCFTPQGSSTCAPIVDAEIPVQASSEFDRKSGSFPFAPAIAGIEPGAFEGEIRLRNDHAAGAALSSADSRSMTSELTSAALFAISSDAASLGQYLDVEGGGFVGGDDDGTTELEFSGTFMPDKSGAQLAMDFSIIPIFQDGRLVRYVLNEDDQLGQSVDLRRDTGVLEGHITPIIYYKNTRQTGLATNFQFRIAPVKQVVFLKVLPSFVATLRFFGLRAMEEQIIERVILVTARDVATINVEYRLSKPTDFELYSTVELAGWNPNCREVERCATLGLDNTPGKDVGNLRLHDYLGVVDNGEGLGFGGVFVQALFGFSKHPHDLSAKVPSVNSELFDEIFDPFRPDEGGTPVTSQDLTGGNLPLLTSDATCPASDRRGQIQCAVWVLGNLIGTTISHEVGHSLGLASPYGSATQYHLPSDEENRLMDNGGDRPFEERAQLLGQGPGRFCTSHYDYLRDILPTDLEPTTIERPSCF